MSNVMAMVLRDPEGKFWDGALVSPEAARELEGRGVATIPVCPELFKRNAIAGFFRRNWGAGWPLGAIAPARVCPGILLVVPNHGRLHWKARLRLYGPSKASAGDGMIRIVPDAAQTLSNSTGFVATEEAAVKLAGLGEPDDAGGWTIGGTVKVQATFGTEQYLPVCLYGHGPGFAVEWLALSQTPEE